MMSSVSCENQIIAVLVVRGAGQACRPREVRDGDRLFVGSDESSDIRLVDDDVASTHCVISAMGGCLTVRDCYSPAGTSVDGNRISEIQLTGNAEINVGDAVILVTLDSPGPSTTQTADSPVANSATDHPDDAQLLPPEVNSTDDEAADELPPDSRDESLSTISDLQLQLDQAHAEIEVLHNRLAASATTSSASNADPYAEEMLELMRAEIIDLQTALAEQNQTATNQMPPQAITSGCDDVLPRDDAEKLVDRLEGLLVELQERDEQVTTLTELLASAEEANRAEREERTQVDAWLKDIEERFGCREQEWQAERNKLQSEVQAIAAERDRAEAAISADSSNTKLEAAQNVLTALRDTAESQRLQLAAVEQANAELRHELELARCVQPHENLVKLAEERAELARQKQELEAARNEAPRPGPNEATLKLQVLREHLKEIHQQEQKELKEQEERKLSSRIARLWSRIESR